MKPKDKNAINPVAQISNSSELERLRNDIFRSDIDKLKLFTKMLRTNAILNKAIIVHK